MLRIRLQRRGRKKRPIHHIVVADSRAPRDGRIIEDLGRFDNITPKNQLTLNEERAIHWIQKGAQPSDTVRSIFKEEGILYKVHLINWGKSEEEIEQALLEWREAREAKAEKIPTRKEKQRALLEAEEKEYQKQLKKKAEEAAKQKAKEEALAAAEEESEEAAETEAAAEDSETDQAAEEAAAQEATAEAEAVEEEAEEETAAADEGQQEVAEEPEEEAAESEEQADKAEATEKAEESEEEPREAAEEEQADETEEETAEEPEKTEADEQVSTDMTAKDAIDHIKNTELNSLEGFVPEEEDRVTVQRAWETKQEEE